MPAVGAAVSVVSAWAASSAVASFLLNTAASMALSAVSQALRGKPKPAGVRTGVTMAGEETPGSLIFGKYATAGFMVCPPMTRGSAGGAPNGFLTYVIELADIPIGSLDAIWIGDEKVEILPPVAGSLYPDHNAIGGRYSGNAWFRFFNGRSDAYAGLVHHTNGPRPWRDDMVGRGVPYVVMRFRFNQDLYQAMPQVLFEVTGIPLYDPRKDSTVGGSGPHRWGNRSTYEPSENPIVQTYNIKRGIYFNGEHLWGGRAEAEDLPLGNWIAAMNVCDQLEGGEPRWRSSFEVMIGPEGLGGDEPAAICEEIFRGCAASAAEFGGVYRVRVGAVGLPVATFTDDDVLISESRAFEPFRGLDQTYNTVQAQYPDPVAKWASKEAPPRQNADFVAEDGDVYVASLSLGATPYPRQVQRVQNLYLLDGRRQAQHNLSLPPEFAAIEVLDAVAWTSAHNGYTTKVFEVTSRDDQPRSMVQGFGLRERDARDQNWLPGMELPSAVNSPTTPPPGPRVVLDFDAGPVGDVDGDGVTRSAGIRMTWNPDQPDARAVRYQIRRRGQTQTFGGSVHAVSEGEFSHFENIKGETAYQVRGELVSNRATIATDWIDVVTGAAGIVWADFDAQLREDLEQAREIAANAARDVIEAQRAAEEAARHADEIVQQARDDLSVDFAQAIEAAQNALRDAEAAQLAAGGANQAAEDALAAARAALTSADQAREDRIASQRGATDAEVARRAAVVAREGIEEAEAAAQESARVAAGSATTAGSRATAAGEAATLAGTRADAAGASAVAADNSRLAAEAAGSAADTARGQAIAARDAAVQARQTAESARATAQESARLAAEARTAAGQGATAAAESAAAAASSATRAGQEASAAEASRLSAEVGAASALPSAIGGGASWTHSLTGLPEAVPSWPGYFSAAVAALSGGVATIKSASTANVHLVSRAVLPWIPGRTIRVTIDMRMTALTSGRVRGLIAALGPTYANVSNPNPATLLPAEANRWELISYDYLIPANPNAAFFRAGIYINGGTASPGDVEVRSILIEDVTEAVAAGASRAGADTARDAAVTARQGAEGAESAARQSATTAARSATDAGGHADAAQGHRTAAQNSASAAGSSATTAGTHATNAGSRATAAQEARLAAEAARDGANTHRANAGIARDAAVVARQDAETAAAGARESLQLSAELMGAGANSVINDTYLSGDGWSRWSGGGILARRSNDHYPVGRTWDFTLQAGQQDGLHIIGSPNSIWPGTKNARGYVVEVDYSHISGSLVGACVLLDWNMSDGTEYRAEVALGAMQAGQSASAIRNARAVMMRPAGFRGTFASHDLYIMAGFRSDSAAKRITIHRVSIRPATEEEMGGGQVADAVRSQILVDYLTSAQTTAAVAALREQLQSDMGGSFASVRRAASAIANLSGSVARISNVVTVDGQPVGAGFEAVAFNQQGGTTGTLLKLIGDNIVAQGTLSAAKLVVFDPANLVPDNQFQSNEAWNLPRGPMRLVGAGPSFNSAGCVRFTKAGSGPGFSPWIQSRPFSVKGNQDFHFEILATQITGTVNSIWARIHWINSAGVVTIANLYAGGQKAGNHRETATRRAPSDAQQAIVEFIVNQDETNGDVNIGDVVARALEPGSVLIEQGGVTADLITAATVRALNGYFSDLAAANVRIGSGEIGRAHIGQLAVDTLRLADRAVSVQWSSNSESLRINAAYPMELVIFCTVQVRGAFNTYTSTYRLFRNNTQIDSAAFSVSPYTTPMMNTLTLSVPAGITDFRHAYDGSSGDYSRFRTTVIGFYK